MLPGKIAPLAAFSAACALVMTTFGGCGSTAEGEDSRDDGGSTQTGPIVAQCPAAAPADGEGCVLPEGTTCVFGMCGTPIVRCSGGLWRHASNEPPRPPCPTETPESDSPCPSCWPDGVSCSYGSADCSDDDASLNRARASCVAAVWKVEFSACRDAGADVQGDADADDD